jgi:hypothetical protein
MKVMVLTLQEDPPTAEIYRDHSYEFSRHFHSMVEKCLRKEPGKRPNVKKLLEHKFFKAAKDRQYIVDKIVKKMPIRKPVSKDAKLLNLCALRHPTLENGGGVDLGGLDVEKGRPVSVGSWVFDKDEFDELKLRVAAEKERDGPAVSRSHSVHQSYADDDTPKQQASAAAAVVPRNNNLVVPGQGNNIPPRVNTPSAHSPSAVEEDSSDHHSDSEHREMPDFSDPNPDAHMDAQTQGIHQITVTSPAGSSSAHSTPQGVTPKLSPSPQPQQQQQSYPAVTTPPHVQSPGSEHTEGRFHIREDEDEEVDEQPVDGEQHFDDSHQYHEDQPQYTDQYKGDQYADQSQYSGGTNEVPDFHVEGDDQHTQHVGRFTVADDEEDQDQ